MQIDRYVDVDLDSEFERVHSVRAIYCSDRPGVILYMCRKVAAIQVQHIQSDGSRKSHP